LNGWTGRQLADALRVDPSRVSRALALLKLPESIQEQVTTGLISPRSAYELSKLPNSETQAALAAKAAAGQLSSTQTANAVRQRQGKPKSATRITNQTFIGDNGWKVVVIGPKSGTYHDIEQALTVALDEVRTRINGRCKLF